MSSCYNISSEKTCFTPFLANNSRAVRKPFEEASHWCKEYDSGSSLIIINSIESQRTVESFIGRHVLANETIILDAQKLSPSKSLEWSWVNGHPTIPIDARERDLQFYDGACVHSTHEQSLAYCFGDATSLFRYICEYSDWKSDKSYRQNNKSYVASEGLATWFDARKDCFRLGGDLASITDLRTIKDWSRLKEHPTYWIGLHRNKWIWKSTGAALIYANWKDGFPVASSDKQCICISPRCRRDNERTTCEAEHDRKWMTCNCNKSFAIVCQKEEKSDALTQEITVTEEMLSSADVKSTASFLVDTSTKSQSSLPRASSLVSTTATPLITTSKKTPIAITPATNNKTPTDNYSVEEISRKTVSTLSMTQTPSNHFNEDQTTAFAAAQLFKSLKTKEILFFIPLLLAVAQILVAVIFIIRKSKCDRRNERSSMNDRKQSETISCVIEHVVPDNRPSDGTVPPSNTIYADVEMTQRPTFSNNSIYASVRPTSEAFYMGKNVVYANLDIPQKVQQKPRCADKITACLSPIYSQPYKPPSSPGNTVYAEPFKPDKRSTAAAPVIYSEQNKPAKSLPPTDKAAKATDSTYLKAIEVKRGATSEGVATQDPSAVYAEPIKLKKSF